MKIPMALEQVKVPLTALRVLITKTSRDSQPRSLVPYLSPTNSLFFSFVCTDFLMQEKEGISDLLTRLFSSAPSFMALHNVYVSSSSCAQMPGEIWPLGIHSSVPGS